MIGHPRKAGPAFASGAIDPDDLSLFKTVIHFLLDAKEETPK
jgi:hypothetical protein